MPPAAGGASTAVPSTIQAALALVPTDVFVITARHEQVRLGVVVTRVVRCADAPPCVGVALMKGHPVSPLIRDSRAFALCALAPGERVLTRMFEQAAPPPTAPICAGTPAPIVSTGARPALGDPFLSLDVECIETGAPVLRRSRYALDCRVVMHLDFEADHELYIGQVVGARVYETALPTPPSAGKSRNGKA